MVGDGAWGFNHSFNCVAVGTTRTQKLLAFRRCGESGQQTQSFENDSGWRDQNDVSIYGWKVPFSQEDSITKDQSFPTNGSWPKRESQTGDLFFSKICCMVKRSFCLQNIWCLEKQQCLRLMTQPCLQRGWYAAMHQNAWRRQKKDNGLCLIVRNTNIILKNIVFRCLFCEGNKTFSTSKISMLKLVHCWKPC